MNMNNKEKNPKSCSVKIKLVSLNVRGLRNAKKRRSLFYLFKRDKYDVVCLQETYLDKNDMYLIDREWGPNYHFSEGTHNSKGLLTLFSKELDCKETTLQKATERFIVSKINVEDNIITFINIYSPCIISEKIRFLNCVSNYISSQQEMENLIVLGDFNIVSDNVLDIISGEKHNEKVVKRFNDFIRDMLFCDIWRQTNGRKKEFTWSKKTPFTARRLDYILTTASLVPFCKDPYINNVGFSDHKAVSVTIDFSSFKRGSSTFKFNVSLLEDKLLIDALKKEINRIKELELDPDTSWEYIKASIKDLGQCYGRFVAQNNRKEKQALSSEIAELEKYLVNAPDDDSAVKKYSDLNLKLELLLIKETEGARIRAGQKWAQEGEKCTKFFLNLEKQRSNSNTIFSLEDNSKKVLNNPADILDFLKLHFEALYGADKENESDVYDNIFCDSAGAEILDENDIDNLDKDLTIEELFNALKCSKTGSAPGSDGLPSEVYKILWEEIKIPLLECYNYSLVQGKLTKSQSTGIICLHHKGKGLSREQVTNWRPISLTNFDYKLLTKALAIRLNSCLAKCVGEDQYAFIKGRQAADLLREIDDILTYGKKQFPESFIVSLDYAKAFDTLSLSAIRKMLTYFGINGVFRNWMEVILNDRISSVRNGGYMSDFFVMERGVRQGCPISPLLFIMTLELLARDIRKNDDIKGQNVVHTNYSRTIKIKMYADDATLFLRDMMDFREVLSRIKMFSKFSGLKLNKQKSAAMKIGDATYKNNIRYGIKFHNKLKILGIIFSNECRAGELEENVEPKIEQLERLCSLWLKRHLTMLGKIAILKAFGVSLFIHLMQSIGISDENLKRINLVIFRFIWNKKSNNDKKVIEKKKRNILTKKYEDGGLNMIDIVAFQNSFLLKWADRLFDNKSNSWKVFPLIFLQKVGGKTAFMCNTKGSKFKGLDLIDSPFWKRVLITWLDYKKADYNQQELNLDISCPIFNNDQITFKNNTIFNTRCIKLGLISIRDFLEHGEIISIRKFSELFGEGAETILVYNIIFNALFKHKETLNRNINFDEGLSTFKGLECGNINRKSFYDVIRNKETESLKETWLETYDIEKHDSNIWLMPFESVSETKLLELQWKILHDIYPSGTLLKKMKITNDDSCVFCGQRDTLPHFFFDCAIAMQIWDEAEKIVSYNVGRNFVFSERDKMIGNMTSDGFLNNKQRNFVNKINLIAKFSISKYKYVKEGNAKLLFERQLMFRGIK